MKAILFSESTINSFELYLSLKGIFYTELVFLCNKHSYRKNCIVIDLKIRNRTVSPSIRIRETESFEIFDTKLNHRQTLVLLL